MTIADIFKDRDGKVVITQKPNLPIIVWFVSVVINKFLSGGVVSQFVSTIGTTAIAVWATLEIISGVNLFRRILGTVVLCIIVVSRFV